jgi:hypothetical protein
MKINIKTPQQSLNGSYINTIVNNEEFNLFVSNLSKLHSSIEISNDNKQTEKHLEKLLNNFFKDVFYKNDFYINSKSYKGLNECDLVIHNGKEFDSNVGVLLELKTPRNEGEMITKESFMKQSFYETILYYLWEKEFHKNNEVHNIVITNFYDWFIIDSKEFEKLFNNKKVKQTFEKWRTGNTDSSKTKMMYEFIKDFLETNDIEITSTYFNLKDYTNLVGKSDEDSIKQLISLYKILSPKHLLNIKNEIDSNTLNKNFYIELLYIIGLTEKTEKGKILLTENFERGSLIDITKNIIKSEGLLENVDKSKFEYSNEDDLIFQISLELCITWINRIIFLKLLENQLINYNGGKDDYSFISSDKIDSFQNLNQLFFEVLSERVSNRNHDIKNKLKKITNIDFIPYLNSSLFEPTTIEKKTLRISGLDDESEILVFSKSITKQYELPKNNKLKTFNYLLRFLECYDFGSSTEKKLLSSKNKTIINSSVLGLIFEKINGYKDGSVFTPSFITTQMCEETFEKIILKKFNETYNWECENYIDLHNHLQIKNIKEYNDLINSIKICDPSVGSGHYLVSMLNEIIRVKSLLGLLCDKENKIIKDIEITIENDELIVKLYNGDLFKYYVNDNGRFDNPIQSIQETLFKEKKTIIENSLFGVDINSNSVQICRLRLWIELLKSSYYTKESDYKELQTLPNIDINIKQGNSLVQKFSFDENLSSLFKGKFKVKDYQDVVLKYKETNDKKIKETLKKYLDELKLEFKTSPSTKLQETYSKDVYEFNQYKIKLDNLSMFDEKVSKKEKEKLKVFELKMNETKNKIKEIETNIFYKDSFEWRFEFPELINEKGEFVGFDVIIGNPPYVVVSKDNYLSKLYSWNSDLYLMFFELSVNKLIKKGGFLSFITPRFYLVNQNCKEIRKSFTDDFHTYKLIETNPFKEVNTECVITYLEKKKPVFESIPIFQEKKKLFHKVNDLEKSLIRKRELYTYITFLTKEIDDVLDSIEIDTNSLINITNESLRGLEIGKKDLQSLSSGIECLVGEDTNRYSIDYKQSFVDSEHKEYKRLEKFFKKDNMILLRRVSKDLKSTIPNKNYSFNKNLYGISLQKEFSNYFVCGLLNSELINFYYKFKYSTKKEDLFPEIQKYLYEQLPIKIISDKNKVIQETIIDIVKDLLNTPDDKNLLNKLDIEVYKLYDLDEVQIKVIKDLIISVYENKNN